MLKLTCILVLMQILICSQAANDDFIYAVSSNQLTGWSTIDITCSKKNNEKLIEKRSINDRIFKNDVSLKKKIFADIGTKLKHRNDLAILNSDFSTISPDILNNEELQNIYNKLINNTVSVQSTASHSVTPILIKNANFSTGFNKSQVNFHCPFISLANNSFQTDQHRLNLFSEGKLLVENNWWKQMTNLTILKIFFETGFSPPMGCSWFPNRLISLDLSHTPIVEIDLGNCSSSLTHLIISGSSLTTFSMCLPSLRDIEISWNALGANGIRLACPEGASKVKKLKFTNNQLSSWSSCGWPSLVNLNLQMNKLIQLDLTSCPLNHLIHLDISHNRLQNSPKRYPNKLTIINISHNNLKKTSIFHRNIQEVDFSHNSITSIVKGTFRKAWQLLRLDLSHNKLSIIYAHDFVGLHELRSLDLSHNSIHHIRHEAFHALKKIQRIILTNNALQQLDTRLLTLLPRDITFEAFRNPWKCSCHLLAMLTKLIRYQCKPNCSQMQELTCKEGHTEVEANFVLRQCIEAIQEESVPEASIYLSPNLDSDEDTSEEDGRDNPLSMSSSYKTMVALIAFFTIFIPIMGLIIRRTYTKRNSIKRFFNCLETSYEPNDKEETIQGWSKRRLQFDTESNSETEL